MGQHNYFLHHCKNTSRCKFRALKILSSSTLCQKPVEKIQQLTWWGEDQWTLVLHASLKCAGAKFVNFKPSRLFVQGLLAKSNGWIRVVSIRRARTSHRTASIFIIIAADIKASAVDLFPVIIDWVLMNNRCRRSR